MEGTRSPSSVRVKDVPYRPSRRHNKHKDGESELEGEEKFMVITPLEQQQWEKMMKSRLDSIMRNKEEHRRWLEAFTRRRLFLNSRIRKLDMARQNRLPFLSKMAEVVKTANEKLSEAIANSETTSEEEQQEGDLENNTDNSTIDVLGQSNEDLDGNDDKGRIQDQMMINANPDLDNVTEVNSSHNPTSQPSDTNTSLQTETSPADDQEST